MDTIDNSDNRESRSILKMSSLITRSRRAALPFVSGILLTLAFPPLSWWWMAWIGLVPAYLSLLSDSESPKAPYPAWKPFGKGYTLGLTLFLVGMYWMSDSDLGLIPYLIVSFIEAIPFGLLAIAAVLLFRRLPSGAHPVLFAALWTLFEGMRSYGRYAFPWFFLSSTQVNALPLLQMVAITAQWGLSFAIALVGGLFAEAYRAYVQKPGRHKTVAFRFLLPGIAIPVLLALLGDRAIQTTEKAEANLPIRTVAAIQGNLDLRNVGSLEALAVYSNLSRDAVQQYKTGAARGGDTSLAFIAWPEEEMRQFFVDPAVHAGVTTLARSLQTSLIIGTWEEEETLYHNSAALVDGSGFERGRYDKQRLVPGGEFVPFREILTPIYGSYHAPRKDFAEGTKSGLFSVSGAYDNTFRNLTPTGILICYEDVFPYLARARVQEGAQMLTLLTSDETFGTTAGPVQHADQAIVRAVETRRYALRAASTGTSEIITATGRVRNQIPLAHSGIVIGDIILHSEKTVAVRWGDWFLWLCAAIVIGMSVLALLNPLTPPLPALKNPGDQDTLKDS